MTEKGATKMAAQAEGVHTENPQARRARKLRPPMHCYWGTSPNCPRNGRITSLGVEGCFIQSKAAAADGQELFVNCWLPSERWLMLRGRVAYHLPKIGFGLTFDLTETEREMVSMLLEFYGEEERAGQGGG
jgi:PilZ domain